jgi:hypothetical protein
LQAIAAPHEMITTFLRFDIATYRSPAAKASAVARVPAGRLHQLTSMPAKTGPAA